MEAPGFLLTFDTSSCCNGDVEEPGICNSSCTAYSFNSGLLTSPNYPDANGYPNDTIHGYSIAQPNGTLINITFHSMDIEGDNPCLKDYLEIRDGTSETAPIIAILCGDKTIDQLQTTQNSLWMR